MDRYTFTCCIARWLSLAVLLVSPLGCLGDVLEEVCPEGRGVLIANATEGVDPSYDAGGLEHWYTLARDFVNTVKRENLPYGTYDNTIVISHTPTASRL